MYYWFNTNNLLINYSSYIWVINWFLEPEITFRENRTARATDTLASLIRAWR